MDMGNDQVKNSLPLPPEIPKRLLVLAEDVDLYQEVEAALSSLREFLIALLGVDQEAASLETGPADIILACAGTEETAKRFLHLARSSRDLALNPVILVAPHTPRGIAAPFFDLWMTLPLTGFQFKQEIHRLAGLIRRLLEYPPLPEALDEEGLRETLVLRFIHSRELSEVIPERDENSPYGYNLPWAEALLQAERGRSLTIMNRLATEGLLTTEVEEVVNLCPHCEDYRITFRQVCPHCGSVRIRSVKMIQQFPCAHLGPETTFIQGDRYVCPKCGKTLKHIGVDYAKPGEQVACEHCGELAQESESSFFCLKCGLTFAPFQGRQFNIYRYRLTPSGMEAAALGLHTRVSLADVLQSFLNIYSYPFFEKYLKMEVRRALRYQTPFSLMRLSIRNLPELEEQLGIGGKMALVRELKEIVGTNIRETDLVSLSPPNDILILLVQADEERAQLVAQRISSRSQELLRAPVEFRYNIVCVPHQAWEFQQLLELSRGEITQTIGGKCCFRPN